MKSKLFFIIKWKKRDCKTIEKNVPILWSIWNLWIFSHHFPWKNPPLFIINCLILWWKDDEKKCFNLPWISIESFSIIFYHQIYKREHKHQFLHFRASCLEMGKVTLSQINTNLYSVPKINVFKIQKGPVNNNFSYCVETILSTDRLQWQRHNKNTTANFLRLHKNRNTFLLLLVSCLERVELRYPKQNNRNQPSFCAKDLCVKYSERLFNYW